MPPARKTVITPPPSEIDIDDVIEICRFCEAIGHRSIKCPDVRTSTQRHLNIKGKNLCIRCLEPNNFPEEKKHDPCPRADLRCEFCVDKYKDVPVLYSHHEILCERNALQFVKKDWTENPPPPEISRSERAQKRHQMKAFSQVLEEKNMKKREESVRSPLISYVQKAVDAALKDVPSTSDAKKPPLTQIINKILKKPVAKFEVGEQLVCLFSDEKIPYEAKVIRIKEHQGVLKYLIHFIGWNKRYDVRIPVGEENGMMFKGTVDVYNKGFKVPLPPKPSKNLQKAQNAQVPQNPQNLHNNKSFKAPLPPKPVQGPQNLQNPPILQKKPPEKRMRADTPFEFSPKRRPPAIQIFESATKFDASAFKIPKKASVEVFGKQSDSGRPSPARRLLPPQEQVISPPVSEPATPEPPSKQDNVTAASRKTRAPSKQVISPPVSEPATPEALSKQDIITAASRKTRAPPKQATNEAVRQPVAPKPLPAQRKLVVPKKPLSARSEASLKQDNIATIPLPEAPLPPVIEKPRSLRSATQRKAAETKQIEVPKTEVAPEVPIHFQNIELPDYKEVQEIMNRVRKMNAELNMNPSPSPQFIPDFVVEEIVESEKPKCIFCDESDHEPSKCTRFPSSHSRCYQLKMKNICLKCLSPNDVPSQNLHFECPRAHEECQICSHRYPNSQMFPAHHEILCESNDLSYQLAMEF
uniref:Tudor-knot domain-containing protein n=1 Tax=Caenorhabditis tropicalis TaxID=1561998 RepID=A0A1I7TTN0_9PELO